MMGPKRASKASAKPSSTSSTRPSATKPKPSLSSPTTPATPASPPGAEIFKTVLQSETIDIDIDNIQKIAFTQKYCPLSDLPSGVSPKDCRFYVSWPSFITLAFLCLQSFDLIPLPRARHSKLVCMSGPGYSKLERSLKHMLHLIRQMYKILGTLRVTGVSVK